MLRVLEYNFVRDNGDLELHSGGPDREDGIPEDEMPGGISRKMETSDRSSPPLSIGKQASTGSVAGSRTLGRRGSGGSMLSRRQTNETDGGYGTFYWPCGPLSFNSCFESGNLAAARYILPKKFSAYQNNYVYDLLLEGDTHCPGCTQWFFFAVKNFAETGVVG